VNADGQRRSVRDLLAHAGVTLDQFLPVRPDLADVSPVVREQLAIEALYAGYLDRQSADAQALQREEGLRLPANLDYAAMGSLSTEVREKLAKVRPVTLGQASRIEGVTPGALTALLAHVKKNRVAA
jgi:tRNA uridine 5-carboxymethylaminomethyl modification enzyme